MNIGLDFDGVIGNSVKLKALATEILYKTYITAEEYTMETFVSKGLSPAQYDDLREIIYNDEQIGMKLEPVDGAIEHVNKLIKSGHKLSIITSRNDTGVEMAKRWANKQGLQLDFVGVGQGNSKARVAQGLDVYVDDDIRKLEHLVGIVPHLFLFSWHYNAHMKTGNIAKRVASWEELVIEINTIL